MIKFKIKNQPAESDDIAERWMRSGHSARSAILLGLPLMGAIAVIGTLPPVNLWPLMFLALAPVYAYIYISLTAQVSWIRLAWGGFLFGVVFSGFLMSQTILQFHWIEQAHLFGTIVKASTIPLLAATGTFSSLSIICSAIVSRRIAAIVLKSRIGSGMTRASRLAVVDFVALLASASVWTFSEWIIRKAMFSIEYSIMGYPASSTFLISLASVGGIFLTIFFSALISMSLGSLAIQLARYSSHRSMKTLAAQAVPGALICASALAVAWAVHLSFHEKSQNTADHQARILTVSVIQDQAREGAVFGSEQDGVFSFPRLESFLDDARRDKQDLIIYPFAPWNGVLYDEVTDGYKKRLFNKNVFAASVQAFGVWEKKHVNPGVVFATWATTYRDSKFFNEITFWKDGALIGTHQKRDLFPFLDYTPAAAARIGLYTTAVDATPGTSTLGTDIRGTSIGALVCSEVTHHVADSTSADRDVILSVGSEAFFSNGIAGYLNLANAKYRAVESGKPVIRANRLGPSAFIDSDGIVTSMAPYGFTGVITSSIEIPSTSSRQ